MKMSTAHSMPNCTTPVRSLSYWTVRWCVSSFQNNAALSTMITNAPDLVQSRCGDAAGGKENVATTNKMDSNAFHYRLSASILHVPIPRPVCANPCRQEIRPTPHQIPVPRLHASQIPNLSAPTQPAAAGPTLE